MNNQAYKPIDMAYMLNDILRDFQNLNSKLAKKDEIMCKFRFEEPKFMVTLILKALAIG